MLSNQLCSDIEAGLEGSSAISAAIAVLQPELAPVAGIIAAALVGMAAVIQLANQRNGVHFDLYWAEILFPPSLVASLIPLPNKKYSRRRACRPKDSEVFHPETTCARPIMSWLRQQS